MIFIYKCIIKHLITYNCSFWCISNTIHDSFHISLDRCDGCFQIMAGIGDKLPLFFVAVGNWLDDSCRQDVQQQRHYEKTHKGNTCTDEQKGICSAELSAAVHKNEHAFCGTFPDCIAVLPNKSSGTLGIPHFFRIYNCCFRCDCCSFSCIHKQSCSVLRKTYRIVLHFFCPFRAKILHSD